MLTLEPSLVTHMAHCESVQVTTLSVLLTNDKVEVGIPHASKAWRILVGIEINPHSALLLVCFYLRR